MYRIRPSVSHVPYKKIENGGLDTESVRSTIELYNWDLILIVACYWPKPTSLEAFWVAHRGHGLCARTEDHCPRWSCHCKARNCNSYPRSVRNYFLVKGPYFEDIKDIYAANTSMQNKSFYNSDGDFLIGRCDLEFHMVYHYGDFSTYSASVKWKGLVILGWKRKRREIERERGHFLWVVDFEN